MSSNYGDCAMPLAYGWNGNNCVLVYGCDLGNDENSFFNTFENVIFNVQIILH